ncbi:acyl-CoA thioesterase [Phnomibacter ginsenosidimutans]|uniref:YbgC/FadM family acyl-CoA thioesterase n=1 Tax=Phnomibacter ginsenosidimutans TaxID=2676868 RepID=A0A6I6GRQ3_9BACT|nr:thioesterase family protein [Phnomibacter ginsenosidimutans]QGW27789.1 YbgC/FadM family acyl-CoA thioesterase [Phnomibacter ginsenosidimutans]
MYTHSTQIRIHYALTDQMGVVYYGNYAQFFEIARTEAIRQLGFTYKELEAMGVMMPVSDMHIHYRKPIRYDELITVSVTVKEWPIGKKITFHGEIHNEAGERCTMSDITLYFVDAKTMRPIQMPDALVTVLQPFFENAD